MNETFETTIPNTNRKRDQRTRLTILILGSIITLAMFYGSGMRAQSKRVEKMYEQVKLYRRDLRLAQMELRTKDALVQQLAARHDLQFALDALNRNDNNDANLLIADAAKRLKLADSADAADLPDMKPIIERLQKGTLGKTEIAEILAKMDRSWNDVLPKSDSPLTKVTVPQPTLNDVPTTGNDVTRTE